MRHIDYNAFQLLRVVDLLARRLRDVGRPLDPEVILK